MNGDDTTYRAPASRHGFALVAVLLILLVLGLLTAGLVLISTEEVWIARGMEELLRARLAAESALRAELRHWRTEEYRGLPVGMVWESSGGVLVPEDAVIASATIERLAGPLYLVQARATAAGGTEAAAATVVRGLEPAELLATFPAALTTVGAVELRGEASLEGFDGELGAAPSEAECLATATQMLESVFGGVERPAILHPHAEGPAEGVTELRLGPLNGLALRGVAERIEVASISPRPVPNTTSCDLLAPGNWGAPLQPDSPCADYSPLIYAPAGLELTGGQGQGILVADGDLTMTGDTEFFGAVLVAGRLRLGGRARVMGAVVVFGDSNLTILEDESSLIYEPCALQAALSRTEAFGRPYHPRDRGWLPGF